MSKPKAGPKRPSEARLDELWRISLSEPKVSLSSVLFRDLLAERKLLLAAAEHADFVRTQHPPLDNALDELDAFDREAGS